MSAAPNNRHSMPSAPTYPTACRNVLPPTRLPARIKAGQNPRVAVCFKTAALSLRCTAKKLQTAWDGWKACGRRLVRKFRPWAPKNTTTFLPPFPTCRTWLPLPMSTLWLTIRTAKTTSPMPPPAFATLPASPPVILPFGPTSAWPTALLCSNWPAI